MSEVIEPEKGVGDLIYSDGKPFIIEEVLPDGQYRAREYEESDDETGSMEDHVNHNDDEHRDSHESSSSASTTSPSQEEEGHKVSQKKVKKGTNKKKVYHKYSHDEEMTMIQDWMMKRPRKGKDKGVWTKMASLISPDVSHLSYQRHLTLLIDNRIKYNKKENETSGEEPTEPTEKEKELDQCIDIWIDVHEGDLENVKQLGEDIRSAALTTTTARTPHCDREVVSPASIPITVSGQGGRRELLSIMNKHEAMEQKKLDFFGETLELKKRKLDLATETTRASHDIQLRQVAIREKELELEEKKLALASKQFEVDSEIKKQKATEEVQERSLLIQFLMKNINQVYFYDLTIIWGYKIG